MLRQIQKKWRQKSILPSFKRHLSPSLSPPETVQCCSAAFHSLSHTHTHTHTGTNRRGLLSHSRTHLCFCDATTLSRCSPSSLHVEIWQHWQPLGETSRGSCVKALKVKDRHEACEDRQTDRQTENSAQQLVTQQIRDTAASLLSIFLKSLLVLLCVLALRCCSWGQVRKNLWTQHNLWNWNDVVLNHYCHWVNHIFASPWYKISLFTDWKPQKPSWCNTVELIV